MKQKIRAVSFSQKGGHWIHTDDLSEEEMITLADWIRREYIQELFLGKAIIK